MDYMYPHNLMANMTVLELKVGWGGGGGWDPKATTAKSESQSLSYPRAIRLLGLWDETLRTLNFFLQKSCHEQVLSM